MTNIDSNKTWLKIDKQKNENNKMQRVTARVISLDFENKKINLDFFGKPAYCSFEDVGHMKFQDISRIFKPNSVHKFCKDLDEDETSEVRLDYHKVHPETLKQGKISIFSTCSGSKNLKKFLFKLIGKEHDEKNSNDPS